MPGAIPTVWEGQAYPSMASAARALGVSKSAMWQAIEQGRGLTGAGRRGVKCYVDGKVYPSAKDAADALGVTPAAISKRRAKMRNG